MSCMVLYISYNTVFPGVLQYSYQTAATLLSLDKDRSKSFIEISTNRSLKIQFNQMVLAIFWLNVRGDYPEQSSEALKVFIPFTNT